MRRKKSTNSMLLGGAIAAASLVASATDINLIRNGSFEQAGGDSVPLEWNFSKSGEAQVSALSTTPGAEGEKCLRIVNRQPEKKAHTFGMLSQTVNIKPDTDYVFSYKARGGAKDVTWTFGKDWLIRQPVVNTTNDWKEFSFTLRVPANKMDGANTSTIRLISEAPGVLDIDDVRLAPMTQTILRNGSFDGTPGQVPAGWSFRISGNAQATATVDTTEARTGKTSFKFVNTSPRKAHVFAALSQGMKVQPEVEYVLKAYVKGEGTGIQIALGTKWEQRLTLNPRPGDWKSFELPFRLAKDEIAPNGEAPLTIISDGITPGIWIDDITITPKVVWNLPAALWQENKVYSVSRFAADINSLQSIPQGLPVFQLPRDTRNTEEGMPDAKDFSAKIAFAFDDKGLILLTEVTDDVIISDDSAEMWKRDSIQVRFDRSSARAGEATDTDLEIGYSVGKDGKVNTWCWDAGLSSIAGKALPADQTTNRAVLTENGYFLISRLGWDILGDIRKNSKFGFTVAINDSDRTGHRAVYFLTPGLHDKKYSNVYIQAMLDTGKPVFQATLPDKPSAQLLEGSLQMINTPESVKFTAELTDVNGKKFTRDIANVRGVEKGEIVLVPFGISLDDMSKGNYSVEFKSNDQSLGKFQAVKADLYEQQMESMTAFVAKLEQLKKDVAEFYGNRTQSEYVAVPLKVLNLHLPRRMKQLQNAASKEEKLYYAEQAAMIQPEIADMLSKIETDLQLLRNGGKLPEVWSFRSSPITLENGWPVAKVVSESGKEERRPMIFTGYGHFGDIDRDIAVLAEYGSNVIQVELGPSSVFPNEGKNKEFEANDAVVKSRFFPLLEKAWNNNTKIALLISPHYHPKWFLQKYPDVAAASGFLKYEVNNPKAREMVQEYIAQLFAMLKASPHFDAIQSICLSNEPVYTSCTPSDPFSRQEFKKYMEKKYGSVADFNKISGMNYADYDAMLDAVSRDATARYEFYTFSRTAFADWHRMMAEAVKKAVPGMPVHTKIMVFTSPFEYVSGVDHELMSDFSEYNGNDNYFYRRGRWIADWNVTAMTHEMQISAKPVSIANTENHIIPDRETRAISNDHIYSANFQQFITGASTLTTWVWADIDYDFAKDRQKHDFIGNVYLRPGNIAAHALAGLDGVRLAPEIRKFMDYQPEVAILYSPTSTILNPGSFRAEAEGLYEELSFTGYRPRFLSERQLAKGEFGKTKLLYVVGSQNVASQAVAGMQKFVEQGGRIAVAPKSLTMNEFSAPLKVNFATEPMAVNKPAALTAQIHQSGIAPLPVSVKVMHAEGNNGVFFRVVPAGDGSYLVNLINYNFDARKLTLEGNGEWYDLIREGKFTPALELAPLKPQLLRFTPKK